MKRRASLKRIALIMATIAGSLTGISFLRPFFPSAISREKRIRIGRKTDFPVDTYTYLEDSKLFIYRDHESMQAISAVCTHLGCSVKKTSTGFECPCHGSCYDDKGKVMSGPAPRSLDWYLLEKKSDGSILVNKSEIVRAGSKFFPDLV